MNRVLLVVAEQAQLPVGNIAPSTVLGKDDFDSAGIGFDSLGLVELVLALEEHFEVSIPEDMKELEAVNTVEDIARVVEKVLLSSKLSAAGLHPQCVDFATGTYEDARKTLSLPTAGAYMVMTTGPATVSGNVEKPSAAEHTQLGLPHVDAGPVADATVEAAPDEHQILADAAGRFLEAICPDFSGYMPRALNRLAQAIEEGRVHVIPNDETDRDQLTYYILEQG
jgi:acyl carrier protein